MKRFSEIIEDTEEDQKSFLKRKNNNEKKKQKEKLEIESAIFLMGY